MYYVYTFEATLIQPQMTRIIANLEISNFISGNCIIFRFMPSAWLDLSIKKYKTESKKAGFESPKMRYYKYSRCRNFIYTKRRSAKKSTDYVWSELSPGGVSALPSLGFLRSQRRRYVAPCTGSISLPNSQRLTGQKIDNITEAARHYPMFWPPMGTTLTRESLIKLSLCRMC